MVIIKADSTKELPLKDNSIDAIVTDPPYGLEFMGKEWDKLESKRSRYKGKERSFFGDFEEKNMHNLPQLHQSRNFKCKKCGKYKWDYPKRKCQCENPHWDTRHYGNEQQAFHQRWLTEAYLVLKPGGSMLVMGGTRTFHRLACAIEDSGFIIKDTLMWIYGSGFPKAQEASTLIDAKILGISTKEVIERREGENPLTPEGKAWKGFKIGGIKPAYESVIWAVKPPGGAYVDNVLKYGVGAVNVDETRIGTEQTKTTIKDLSQAHGNQWGKAGIKYPTQGYKDNPKGRFPANIILDEEAAKMLDEQSGMIKSAPGGMTKFGGIFGNKGDIKSDAVYTDGGGASRFFYCAKASIEERNLGLELMEDKMYGQSGGAQIALSKGESEYKQEHIGLNRIKIVKNDHPTVKPIALFEWMIKLVTRKGQIVFDPFIGSGTTAIAALNCERKCIGLDKEFNYLQIAKTRTQYWNKLPKQLDLFKN